MSLRSNFQVGTVKIDAPTSIIRSVIGSRFANSYIVWDNIVFPSLKSNRSRITGEDIRISLCPAPPLVTGAEDTARAMAVVELSPFFLGDDIFISLHIFQN